MAEGGVSRFFLGLPWRTSRMVLEMFMLDKVLLEENWRNSIYASLCCILDVRSGRKCWWCTVRAFIHLCTCILHVYWEQVFFYSKRFKNRLSHPCRCIDWFPCFLSDSRSSVVVSLAYPSFFWDGVLGRPRRWLRLWFSQKNSKVMWTLELLIIADCFILVWDAMSFWISRKRRTEGCRGSEVHTTQTDFDL